MNTCKKCEKGFITEVYLENAAKTENTTKIFCSNALCSYNKTLIENKWSKVPKDMVIAK